VRRAREEALERILEVLQEVAREDERVARALKRHGLAF